MLNCAFAGHRAAVDAMDEFRIPRALAAAIEELLGRDEVFCFYFGGTGWFDRLSARVVRRAKLSMPEKCIRLALVLPYARGVGDASLYDEILVPEELQQLKPHAAIPERYR